ncbi:hypothetical protein ASPZODRAFT_152745 [Penicilliopsis zonata CBS 506.65]|uniref:N-acetyltransferase domain-containing protein n=1 Tax=Penicilliopsis zonata CBS 506.65 TaxID=1073090 RepID=A0A1L9SF11_9EURO|nr:hypothetical protein ASPZODRAFT_152745 [Penicilliopsis zonata CBS 506.65]OJJ45742.1 hypothetical protein ASPZODRAFT_152745 [Penicilliopsis zonata CBS 506.65]
MTVGLPVGLPVDLPPAQLPSASTLPGRTVSLERLTLEHADGLFACLGGTDAAHRPLWTYIPDGPYEDVDSFRASLAAKIASANYFFAVIDRRAVVDGTPNSLFGREVGYICLMRIEPAHFCVEMGHVLFSPFLQRTVCASEAVYLLACYAIDTLGYRRLEWKCDSLNAKSRHAALRYGFAFEGIFRQHLVIRGRNRDTAWFSILREEWQGSLRGAMEAWLDEANFNENGTQKRRLEEFRK